MKLQLKAFFQRRVLEPILNQLRQGTSPRKIALSIALGTTIGIFPILGSTTLLCALAAFILKLNQPSIQLFNYLASPIQIITIPLFVRMGEWIFRADPMSFSVTALKDQFLLNPVQFMEKFGLSGAHGIAAWFLVAPAMAFTIYCITHPLLKTAAVRSGLGAENV